MNGRIPDVVWDFRNIEARHMSMAALTTFLSIAYRLREFAGRPQKARLRWDPQVFAFWDDIGQRQLFLSTGDN
jgi:hypothetical protein